MKVLHLDSEMSWRGGQNQTKILIEGMLERELVPHLAANPKSAMVERMKGRIPILEVSLTTGLSFSAAKKIRDYCQANSIDILDVQSAKALGTALLVKRSMPKLKLVVHRRLDLAPKKFILSRMKYMSPHLDRFVAISNAIGQILEDYGIKKERIRVVRSAASPRQFNFATKAEAKAAFAAKTGFKADVCWLGNVSALSPQKDYPTLLRALTLLKKERQDFHCFIAGEGDLADALGGMAREFNLSDHVTFLGFREDVPDLLQALDILVMPSKFEGLGTVMLDATEAGCCIVATNVGGIPEMVIHNETGLLVPVGSQKELAKALAQAIASPELRVKLNDTAKMLVKQEFSASKMVEGNLAVYRELLQNQ